MGAAWKTVRLFISSTFRDMHAERDHLIKVVFPRLRPWCEARRLHLVDIDLRWGVTREQADNGQAVEICLAEIDRCRPFFLCLLGERYGWVAPAGFTSPALAKFPGLRRHPHCSVTHLEILHAVQESLAAADPRPPCRRAFFCFRKQDCLPAAPRSSLQRRLFRPRDRYAETFFEQDPRRARALADLKRGLRESLPERVCDYAGVWDPEADNPEDDQLHGRLAQLDAFGAQVEAFLRRAILDEFAAHITSADTPDPLAEEQALHEAFIENRTRVYVPRPDIERALTAYATGDEPRALVLSGPPGSGKSSLLTHWARMQPPGDTTFLLARFIGASPASTDLPRLLANVAAELVRHFRLTETVEETDASGRKATREQPATVPEDPEEVLRAWPHLLEAAGARGRVVLVLDALNQLDRTADTAPLSWLPRTLPPGVRLIVSVLDRGDRPASATEADRPDWLARLRRLNLPEVALPELSDADCREVIRELPSVFCKTLDEAQVALLLQNGATRNPLFLTVALEELPISGERTAAAICPMLPPGRRATRTSLGTSTPSRMSPATAPMAGNWSSCHGNCIAYPPTLTLPFPQKSFYYSWCTDVSEKEKELWHACNVTGARATRTSRSSKA